METRKFCIQPTFLKLNSHTTIKKIISVKMNDVGDAAVTCVPL